MTCGALSDSVSSADGIHTQRPLEQRSNARGASVSGRGGRPSRGRGHVPSTQSNDRPKPSSSVQQATPPVSNDIAVQSSAASATPVSVSASKEANDSGKSATEKTQAQSESKPSIEPSANSAETAGSSTVPAAGDWFHHRRYVIASNVSKVILKSRSRLFIVLKIVISMWPVVRSYSDRGYVNGGFCTAVLKVLV